MPIWYSDDKTEIFFKEEPRIGIRYILPSMSKEEKKSVKKYPFINKTPFYVILTDKTKNVGYSFVIPKGYCFDGASVPRFFWRIIGSNTDNKFLVAAMVHDYMCENHLCVANDRKFSTLVFEALLKVSEVGKFKRFLMKNSVNVFQCLFCDWKEG